ncbi:hypothetical protein TNCV_4274971 [Trichonephila clavipes]|nr:hypothetical protein TNCV_4274971 [Trichonephila clavipes]
MCTHIHKDRIDVIGAIVALKRRQRHDAKRIKRAHQLAEQIESRNLAQRISTAEGHAQESQEQCNERLQENIIRTRAAGERDIATVGAQEQ